MLKGSKSAGSFETTAPVKASCHLLSSSKVGFKARPSSEKHGESRKRGNSRHHRQNRLCTLVFNFRNLLGITNVHENVYLSTGSMCATPEPDHRSSRV